MHLPAMSKALVRLTVSSSEGGEIKLEVGDHSPIWVIKEELQRETGRPVRTERTDRRASARPEQR